VRVWTISQGSLKSKYLTQSFIVSLFDVQNNFIEKRITTKAMATTVLYCKLHY